MLHISPYISIYNNISATVWFDSKIYFIKPYHFPPCLNQNQVNSNINYKLLRLRTCWTCYLVTKGIYYFYS